MCVAGRQGFVGFTHLDLLPDKYTVAFACQVDSGVTFNLLSATGQVIPVIAALVHEMT